MAFCVMIVLIALRSPPRHILYIISGDDYLATGI